MLDMLKTIASPHVAAKKNVAPSRSAPSFYSIGKYAPWFLLLVSIDPRKAKLRSFFGTALLCVEEYSRSLSTQTFAPLEAHSFPIPDSNLGGLSCYLVLHFPTPLVGCNDYPQKSYDSKLRSRTCHSSRSAI